jgi:hypothetical protein
MESKTTFVWAKGTVELKSKSAVDMNVALIVLPGDAKYNLPFRFDQSLKNPGLDVFRMLLEYRPQTIQHFFYRLVEFHLAGIAFENLFVNALDYSVCCHLNNLH